MLTPPGRGALATVAVRGENAASVVGRRFEPAAGKPLESLSIGRVVLGRFFTAAQTPEELVVGLPAVGEVEIHCHGGIAAVEAIVEALVDEGCLVVEPAQWAGQAEEDPLAAAALVALSEARTEAAAAVLLDQYRGALREEIDAIGRLLVEERADPAADRLCRLLDRGEFGLHLTRPWRIVLAGRPNAGKSSLINAILGYERAIVFPQPGTTRDVLTAWTALGGWPAELADTAGLRLPGDPLEAEGVQRAREQAAAAEMVVLVADTTAPWDEALFRDLSARCRRILVVHNKSDLSPPPADGRPAGPIVSAETGEGIDELCCVLARTLVPDPPPAGAAVPFTAEQIAGLEAAAERVSKGDLAAAAATLEQIGREASRACATSN